MRTRRILLATAIASFVALVAGCSSTPSSAPTPEPAPVITDEAPDAPQFDIGWIAEGSMIGVLTHGSSSCVPTATDVDVVDGMITVTLSDAENQVCTMDYAPRVTGFGVPVDVDVTQPLTVVVTYGEAGQQLDLAAASAADSGDFAVDPGAGYIGPNTIALLTYGSSSCRPVVGEMTEDGDVLNVTFAAPAEQACTDDLAPRVTTLGAAEGMKTIVVTDESGYQTTLPITQKG